MLKKKWKKAVSFLIVIAAVVSLGRVQVRAAAYWPDAPQTLSESVMLIEESTGTVLYEKNSEEAHYPASITKILTTLIALENGTLSDVVTFSDDSIDKTEGSGIARDYGEQMTLEQCLYAVMLESANECAYAVAEHVGGTVENFVDMMNEKAKELGCANTHFANPHGLHDENHYTTARDMALIAQAAYENEMFRAIIGTKIYTIPPTNKHPNDNTILRNHHDMLSTYRTANQKYLYPYCTGGKTGYTAAANSTLVTYAEKDGMTLICVVMNAQSPNQLEDTYQLFEYAFDSFQVLNIAEYDTSDEAENMAYTGNLSHVKPFVEIEKDAVVVLPKTAEFSDLQSSAEYNDEDTDIAGTITYTYEGRNVGTAQIKRTGVVIEGYAFDNQTLPQQQETSEIQIKPVTIVLLCAGAVVFIVLLICLKKFYDNFYIIKHNRQVRQEMKKEAKAEKIRRRRRR